MRRCVDNARVEHDKLVRDKIPEILARSGIRAITHLADEREYGSRLMNKLSEEVEEFRASRAVEELADVLEVVYALADVSGVSEEELGRLRADKAEARGAFGLRIVLERTEPSVPSRS